MNRTLQQPCPVINTLPRSIDLYKQCRQAQSAHDEVTAWLQQCLSKEVVWQDYFASDYWLVLNFLYSYRGSPDTFRAYRRDIERLIQWSWLVRQQSILLHRREDIEAFIEFCIQPPKHWIGLKTVNRFKLLQGQQVVNPDWRPFDVSISKADRRAGKDITVDHYHVSHNTVKAIFAVLSSFYQFMYQEGAVSANPVSLIRQKSKFLRKEATAPIVRRLSDQQWLTVLKNTELLAASDPDHERTLFMMTCLYGMYLRISELAATDRWVPTMNDFFQDSEQNWWFKTVGKGNKARQIAVSSSVLNALKRYRQFLGMTPLPVLTDDAPLIGQLRQPQQPLCDTKRIRVLVQICFDRAAEDLSCQGLLLDADQLRAATVHWLRHTGISDDVKVRPREHVRDDAGHSSGATTDRYIDINLRERAQSAKQKKC